MNIYLNSLYSHSASFLKERVLPTLTNQQKKIVLIVSIAFGCLATLYSVYYCSSLRVGWSEKDLNDNKLHEIDSSFNANLETEILQEEISLELISKIPPLGGPLEIDENDKAIYSESEKVRTLCLELLSNIEDIQIAEMPINENSQTQFNEFRDAVKYFLEQGALEKRAGFADFLQLLEILKEGSEQLNNLSHKDTLQSILERHSKLLNLQESLKQEISLPSESDLLDKIMIMVRSGLLTKEILETAHEAKALGLNPIPALPKPQKIYNLYPILDKINLLSSEYREAGRWLMYHTSVFTFRELCQSIKKSCDKLSDEILNFDDYYLLSIKGKSQEWMMDIGYRYLPPKHLPKGILTVGETGGANHQVENLLEKIIESGSNNFIMFDDITYTGTQLSVYLDDLEIQLYDQKPQFMETKNIYFIYGASSKNRDWESIIKKYNFERHNVNVRFNTSHLFDNIQSLMDKENLSDSMRSNINEMGGYPEKTLQLTEWKIADYVSIPTFVTEAYLEKSQLKSFDISKLKSGKLSSLRLMQNLFKRKPITAIITPY